MMAEQVFIKSSATTKSKIEGGFHLRKFLCWLRGHPGKHVYNAYWDYGEPKSTATRIQRYQWLCDICKDSWDTEERWY